MNKKKPFISLILTLAIVFSMIPSLFASATGAPPAVPGSVKATATGAGRITVSWSAVTGATQYNVYRYEDDLGRFKYLGTTFATSNNPTQYVNTGLTIGTTYRYYVVSVIKANGTTAVSDNSAEVSAKALDVPAAPTGVTAAATADRQITVSWNAVAGATQYNVYRYEDSLGRFKYLGTTFATDANPTQFVNTGLTVGTTYRYYVVSVRKSGSATDVSEQSAEASAQAAILLAAPTGVKAAATADRQITVSWNTVAGATQYNVYRYEDSLGRFKYLGTTFATDANPTQFVNTGLTVGTTYRYYVVSVKKSGSATDVSEQSAEASAQAAILLAAPTGVKAAATADRQITVSWNAVAGATQYNVYRYEDSLGRFKYLGTTFAADANPTQFVNTGLTVGTTYRYYVVSVKKSGSTTDVSEQSAEASAQAAILLAAPTGVTAAATADRQITVSWNAVAGATQYNVYRYEDSLGRFKYLGTTFAADANPTQFVNTGLTVGAEYRYYVVSVKKSGSTTEVSAQSEEASAVVVNLLTAPTGVKAAASGNAQITVSWDVVASATQYNIYRYEDDLGRFKFFAAKSATDDNPTRLVNTGLTIGAEYRYYVVSVKKSGTKTEVSEQSAEVSATAVGTPAIPTGVAAAATGNKQITVSWNAVVGATQYNISRYNAQQDRFIYLGTTFATDANPAIFVNTGLTVGTTYRYQVVAVSKTAAGTFIGETSAEASAAAAGIPNVPSGVAAAADGTDQITVTWNAVPGATQYNIYRYNAQQDKYSYIGTTFTTDAAPTQFVNTELTAGTNYSYKVVSVSKTNAGTFVSAMSEAAETATAAIIPLQDDDVVISATCFRSDGTVKQPVVTVTVGGAVLAMDTDYTVTFSGDCIENGSYTVTVTGIGLYSGSVSKVFVISETGHTPEVIAAVEATCTTDGNTEGSRCSVCGTVLTAPVVLPALGHEMTKTDAVKATCLAGGNLEYYTCGKCQKVFVDAYGATETTVEARTVAQLPHSYTGDAVNNGDGTHSFLCVNGCDEKGPAESCADADHKTVAYPPTCELPAYTEIRCEACESVLSRTEDETSQPVGHKAPVRTPPTCLEDAYYTTNCDHEFTVVTTYADGSDDAEIVVCGFVSTVYGTAAEDKAPGSHDLSESGWTVTTEPTCYSVGIKSQACARCGEVCTEEIETTGHRASSVLNAPTCTEPGSLVYTCTVCHQVLSETEIAPKHSFETVQIVDPTCTEPGIDIQECKNCTPASLNIGDVVRTTVDKDLTYEDDCGTITAINGDEYTLDFSILGGEYEGVTDTYTLDELSLHTIQCVEIPATGHTASLDANNPNNQVRTCTQDGIYYYTGTCTVCHEPMPADPIILPKYGHTPNRDTPTCTDPVLCTRCREVLEPAGHDYVIPQCAIFSTTEGFYCQRCGALPGKNERALILAELLNQLKDDDYYFPDPTVGVKKVTEFNKSKMSTSYTTFDFGIYTSAVRSIYEKDVPAMTVEYEQPDTGSIGALFPFPNKNFAIRNGFGEADLDNIKVETINGFNTASLFTGFSETDDNKDNPKRTPPDLSQYNNKAVSENVIKVTVDLRNEIYAKDSNLTNIDTEHTTRQTTDGKIIKTYLTETSISKVFNYDIRKVVDNAGFSESWTITDGGEEDGYEMNMTLNIIKADAKVVYYFAADNYEPIAAEYHLTESMDQDLTMKILTFNGVIKPVIVTERDYVYIFSDYFKS